MIPHLIVISPNQAHKASTFDQLLALADDERIALLIREPEASRPTLDSLLTRLETAKAKILLHTRTPGAANWVAKHPEWGIHLSSSEQLSSWREKVPGTLGQSTHSLEEANIAFQNGADYITLSPAFQPISKPNFTRPLLSVETLLSANEMGHTFALGGLNAQRFKALRAKGLWGGAVLGDIFEKQNPVAQYF